MSKGEDYLIDLFNREGVKFEREKSFEDCRGGRYRFDFYLPLTARGRVLVEYDGEQHFQFIPRFFKFRSDFLKAQEHDRRKNSYCLANSIPLYRIPYWAIGRIHSVSDIFQDEFLVKSRWHNDNLSAPK